IHVMAETAPQRRLDVDRGVTVANCRRIVEPLGRGAVPVLAHVIPLAVTTRKVVLEKNEVSLREALQPLEVASDLGEKSNVLMPHDDRRTTERKFVLADVCPP